MILGDMMVAGTPPAKLLKALAVIADSLHDEFGRHRLTAPDKTKESCVLASAAVREFLFRIGFVDVEIRPCFCFLRACRGDDELHSMGIGDDELTPVRDPQRPGYWRGHMVAVVPSAGYLIDTTLYRAATRPAFAGLPGMFAVPLLDPADVADARIRNLPPLAFEQMKRPNDETETIDMFWLDQPQNRSWKDGPDYRRRDWRVAVARRLVQQFGQWDG